MSHFSNSFLPIFVIRKSHIWIWAFINPRSNSLLIYYIEHFSKIFIIVQLELRIISSYDNLQDSWYQQSHKDLHLLL